MATINQDDLIAIVKAMIAQGKGILAADESSGTANKRLASVNVEQNEENRRLYRDLFLATEGIEQYLGGVILYDETIRQNALDGTPFTEVLSKRGILPGIKVDTGAKDFALFPEEKITEGLDGLRDRLIEYHGMGARFTKWRAVIMIRGDEFPTEQCIAANAHALARYAGLSQEQGLVPMVEPEVLLEGEHSSEKAEAVTTHTLQVMFDELQKYHVWLPGVILKTSMVVPGNASGESMVADTVAEMTTRCLTSVVPKDLGGVVFLSGGQSAEQATENLQAITARGPHPWTVSFSYARALQGPSLQIWRGSTENVNEARAMFTKRLQYTSAARDGKFTGE